MQSELGRISNNTLAILLMIIMGALFYALITFDAEKNSEQIKFNKKNQTQIIHKTYFNQETKKTEDQKQQINKQEPIKIKENFQDGLGHTNTVQYFELNEFGAGIAAKAFFMHDINKDGKPDRITRTRHETGTANFSNEYAIELNQNGQFIDITPEKLNTVEGIECARTKFLFKFKPRFELIKISRQSASQPDMSSTAIMTRYVFANNQIVPIETKDMGQVCDVRELFQSLI